MDRNQCGRGIIEGEGGQEGGSVHDRPNKGFCNYCTMKDGQGIYKGQGIRMWER